MKHLKTNPDLSLMTGLINSDSNL